MTRAEFEQRCSELGFEVFKEFAQINAISVTYQKQPVADIYLDYTGNFTTSYQKTRDLDKDLVIKIVNLVTQFSLSL